MAVYPPVRAGTRLTKEVLTSMQEMFIVKTTSTSRSSTATPTDDPELTMSLLANATYWVEFNLHVGSATAGAFQTLWNTPASSSCLRGCFGPGDGVTLDGTAAGDIRSSVHGVATDVEYGDRANDNTFQYMVIERGWIQMTTAGTLALQWSQASSSGTATIVYSGSYVSLRRLG